MYQMPIPDSPEPGEPQRGFPIKDAKPWMNRVSAILLAIDGMLGTLALLSWAVQLLNAAN